MTEAQRLESLSVEDKRELLKNLLSLRGGNARGPIPLSYGQQSLWFVHQLAPQSPAYNFLYAVRIPGALDYSAFVRACQSLTQRHDALRTRFIAPDNKPAQVIDEKLEIPVPISDAAGWPDERLLDFVRKRADEPFDLERGPALRIELFKKSASDYVLLLVFHHIIADLWSADLLVQELKELYLAERAGRKAALPAVTGQFADFVRWQTVSVHGQRGQKSWNYWQTVLSGELPVLNLPTDRPRPPVQTYNGTAYSRPINSASAQKLRSLVKERHVTPFIALLSVYQLMLHRLTGQDDLLVGTAVADRGRPEWERLVGYFLNQVVLRADFSSDLTFDQLLERTRDQVHQALDHQDFPFGLLVKKLQPQRDPSRSPIFQTVFIWDKPRELEASSSNGAELNGKSLKMEPLLMEQRGAPFDLTFIIFEIGDTLTASYRYNSDLFDAETIQRMAGHFETLLDEVLARPDIPLSQIPILSAAERQRMLVDWNQTRVPYPEGCWHDLFEKRASATPTAPAILFEEQTISYGELNRRANQLACHLQGLGTKRGDIVAISLPRHPDIIVSIVAAWKAGAAYMFLDPTYPPKRLAAMVQDAQPAVLITPQLVPDLTLPTVALPNDWEAISKQSDGNLDLPRSADDIAYIIYTSGSTGQPKGTVLRHRGLCAMSRSLRELGLQPADRLLQFASFSFDASVFEMTQALTAGASLVMGTQASTLPGPGLVKLVADRQITTAVLPPSALAALAADSLPSVRNVQVAGEACPAELAADWSKKRRFFNLYGPTEITVWATCKEVKDFDGKPPTIGKPIPNARVYVVDRWLQPVPIGVAGELCVAGPTVAAGYLNQPELTAERFVPNPFDASDDAVMYRTGDLVRWNISGELEFLGRTDHQVKIRGYRIELEEIQEVLRRHAAVTDAVVVARQDNGQPALAAYVVPKSMTDFPIAEVRAFLRERLPHYMLPAAIVPLEAFPLGGYGKVDRKRLPKPSGDVGAAQREIVAPRGEAETLLWEVWKQVLGTDNFGVHENFFDLGGASIQTLEVVSLANARGLALAPEMIFRYQTIADLATACGSVNGVLTNGVYAPTVAAPAIALPEATSASPARERSASAAVAGAIVESIGIYLPEQVLTTTDVIEGCRKKLDFPLERLTGIRSRRVVAGDEFSINLAENAATECLRRTRHRPEDIDLLICCNISRFDGPNFRFGMEPTTAARLRSRFGLVNALAFDITNACAGTFTALTLADELLRHKVIRRAMVVSGEYITHLTRGAQLEIENFMDSRLPCLTLGDSGVALILEQAPSTDVGFQEIELYTLGKYHDLCVAKMTREAHGGAMMYTDPVKATAVAIRQEVSHAVEVLRRMRWEPENIDALIMHQTSETTLDGAVREINRALGKQVVSRGNTVYNVAERGNTATNTHFLAVYERIQAGDIEPGDRVLFAVSGSGQTVGTALYKFDDLPVRLREPVERPLPETTDKSGEIRILNLPRPVQVESIGTISGPLNQDGNPVGAGEPADTIAMLRRAGEACLQVSARARDDIDLVLHTGVYRTDFLSEPALAAIAAGELRINHDDDQPDGRRTLALDLMNGAAGTLTAALLAGELIANGKFGRALLLASEVENNALTWADNLIGLEETASALLLESSATNQGFVSFCVRAFPDLVKARECYTGANNDLPVVFHHQDPDWDRRIADCVRAVVTEFLEHGQLKLSDFRWVVPPQAAPSFRKAIGDALAIPEDRLLDLGRDKDLFTSSLAHCLAHLRDNAKLRKGDKALFIEAAAGVQVTCAAYQA